MRVQVRSRLRLRFRKKSSPPLRKRSQGKSLHYRERDRKPDSGFADSGSRLCESLDCFSRSRRCAGVEKLIKGREVLATPLLFKLEQINADKTTTELKHFGKTHVSEFVTVDAKR